MGSYKDYKDWLLVSDKSLIDAIIALFGWGSLYLLGFLMMYFSKDPEDGELGPVWLLGAILVIMSAFMGMIGVAEWIKERFEEANGPTIKEMVIRARRTRFEGGLDPMKRKRTIRRWYRSARFWCRWKAELFGSFVMIVWGASLVILPIRVCYSPAVDHFWQEFNKPLKARAAERISEIFQKNNGVYTLPKKSSISTITSQTTSPLDPES